MVKISRLHLTGFDPAIFFRKLGTTEKSVAYFTSGPWIVIAWNPKKTFVGDVKKTLKDLKKSIPKYTRRTDLPFTGGAIGWVSYDAAMECAGVKSRHKKISRMPSTCFHQYDSALLFDGKRIITVGDAAFRASVRAIHLRPLPRATLSPISWAAQMTQKKYSSIFRHVMKGIRSGDYYQLNLTYPLNTTSKNNPRTLFAALLAHNPASASVYLEHASSSVISSSPERFVLIEKGCITASPIKGTRPRGKNSTEDHRYATDLLHSKKEQAELAMITDLLRNDIGKVSTPGSVRVRGYRLLQKNPSVWHTYSLIEGALRSRLHPLDAFASMLPAGSITGCPKMSAMEQIDRLEHQRRGLYCGTGVMISSSGRLDSTVLIRTIVQEKSRLTIGTGGGIVADSDADEEFLETQKKAQRILSLPARRTWINGREVTDDDRLVALDPSRADTSGVFETMRIEHGRILHLSSHLSRMKKSVKLLGISRMPPEKRIRRLINIALRFAQEGGFRMKLVVTGADVMIEARPLVLDPAERHGIAVSLTSFIRSLPEAKALPYHQEWAAFEAARAAGYGETLLASPDEEIPEAAISNLFSVKKGVLMTAKNGMLKGIMRGVVLREARKLGIRIAYKTPALTDLLDADEVFLTRSLSGIIPVVKIGARAVGKGKVGRITRKLQKIVSAKLQSS